jgi:hypothetical protein
MGGMLGSCFCAKYIRTYCCLAAIRRLLTLLARVSGLVPMALAVGRNVCYRDIRRTPCGCITCFRLDINFEPNSET